MIENILIEGQTIIAKGEKGGTANDILRFSFWRRHLLGTAEAIIITVLPVRR